MKVTLIRHMHSYTRYNAQVRCILDSIASYPQCCSILLMTH